MSKLQVAVHRKSLCMAETFFLLNFLLTAGLLLQGFYKRTGYLEVPFLSALIYAVWFLPQAWVLLDDATLPSGSLSRLLGMSCLCLVAIWIGWKIGIAKKKASTNENAIKISRLILPALIITLFAIAMRAVILAQPAEFRAAGQWTGPLTIVAFFAQVGVVSLVLSFVIVLKRRTSLTISLVAANIFLYLTPLLMTFRRADTFEFVFACLLCAFFLKKWLLPRIALIAGIAVSFAFINSIGQLRALGGGYALNEAGEIETRIPTLREMGQIDWFDFESFLEAAHISEARNAAIFMDVAADQADLGWGAGLWDRYVHGYVPAQILGRDFKESLYVGKDLSELAFQSDAFSAHTGTTSTGFTILYYDFWYLGALVFFVIALYMGQLFERSRVGSISALIIYAVLLPMSLHGITHYGYYVLVQAPLPLFATWFAFWFASKQAGGSKRAMRARSKSNLASL